MASSMRWAWRLALRAPSSSSSWRSSTVHPLLLAPLVVYAAGLVTMLGCSAAYNLLRSSRRHELAAAPGSCRHLRHDRRHLYALHDAAGPRMVGAPHRRDLGGGGRRHNRETLPATPHRADLDHPLSRAGLDRPRRRGPLPGVARAAPRLSCSLQAACSTRWASSSIFGEDCTLQNAIWHGFVLVATVIHYVAVLTVIPTTAHVRLAIPADQHSSD